MAADGRGPGGQLFDATMALSLGTTWFEGVAVDREPRANGRGGEHDLLGLVE